MYYKVLKNNRVIDVLDKLVFLKYQPKHETMILCDENEAQAILSSDKNTIWHEISLYKIPVDGFESVEIQEIDKYEYEQLRILGMKSPEQIADELVLDLINSGII